MLAEAEAAGLELGAGLDGGEALGGDAGAGLAGGQPGEAALVEAEVEAQGVGLRERGLELGEAAQHAAGEDLEARLIAGGEREGLLQADAGAVAAELGAALEAAGLGGERLGGDRGGRWGRGGAPGRDLEGSLGAADERAQEIEELLVEHVVAELDGDHALAWVGLADAGELGGEVGVAGQPAAVEGDLGAAACEVEVDAGAAEEDGGGALVGLAEQLEGELDDDVAGVRALVG